MTVSDQNGRSRSTKSSGHPIPTPSGVNPNAGVIAAASWLSSRGLEPVEHKWDIEIGLGVADRSASLAFDPARETRFQLQIYAEEWGFRFAHAGRHSWIRVTDIPFVHGADEHDLLSTTPALKDIGRFVRHLETCHAVTFHRRHAAVSTTIPEAEPLIRSWLLSL
jgi:hypothetical protein